MKNFHGVFKYLSILLIRKQPYTFSSVAGNPDMEGEVSGLSLGHTNTFKNGTYSSYSVLVIITLSIGNALAIKGATHSLYNGPSDKGGIIQKSNGLIR